VSSSVRHKTLFAALVCACSVLLAPAGASAAEGTGGATFQPPPPPPKKATIINGKAVAPANAPRSVKRMIAAGNRLIGKPYRYGGGHQPFKRAGISRKAVLDSGYDCSGTISFALYGARKLRTPLASPGFMSWGRSGPGNWVTVYTNSGHAYIVIAGLRLDTGMRDDPSKTGPQWSKKLRRSDSFVARHPRGL